MKSKLLQAFFVIVILNRSTTSLVFSTHYNCYREA